MKNVNKSVFWDFVSFEKKNKIVREFCKKNRDCKMYMIVRYWNLTNILKIYGIKDY